MSDAKTKPTAVSVDSYLAAIADITRRDDCRALTEMMQRLSGYPPTMWGASIVGFGQYHYRYASGHEGDWFLVGFSSRKGDISLYLLGGFESPHVRALLDQLGRHKIGKGCLYVKRLADIHVPILEQLIAQSLPARP